MFTIYVNRCMHFKSGEKMEQDLEKQNPPPTSQDHDKPQDDTDATEDPNKYSDAETEVDLSNFFLPDGAKAHYKGEGNEFSTLAIEVHKIGEQFVAVDEDNGGTLIRKLYRIDEDKISLLSEDVVHTNIDLPSEELMKDLKPVEVYLQKPLKVGNKYDHWEIIETNSTVETPYKKFDNAIVIEMVDDGFINRKYFVPNYGEVKRESIMQCEGDEDFIVTSSLETVN